MVITTYEPWLDVYIYIYYIISFILYFILYVHVLYPIIFKPYDII